jgi:hypothetical protein
MTNDVSPGFCTYNPSSSLHPLVNPRLTKSCICLNLIKKKYNNGSLRTSKGELTINLEVWKLSIRETGKFSNFKNTTIFPERIRFWWTRACYEHQKPITHWNGPKFGTWVYDDMINDVSPWYCIYNPSCKFSNVKNTTNFSRKNPFLMN